MKQNSLRGIVFAAIAGMVLAVHAQDSQYPVIVQQPLDQCLALGSTATFSVVAANATGYQWLFNGNVIDGETNSSIQISSITLDNVGLYSAFVFNGGDSVPTRSAILNVYVTSSSSSSTPTSPSPMRSSSLMSSAMLSDPSGGSLIVVFGAPVVSRGGGGTSCPGKYSGYVNFIPPSGWGFLPDTNTTTYTATDTNQTITKVQYGGCYGDNACAQTTVTLPYPGMSPQYRFTIYFPTGTPVPTNAYPISLYGFDP
jgi:hypothetical protein